jgi:hypothetical protein
LRMQIIPKKPMQRNGMVICNFRDEKTEHPIGGKLTSGSGV